jgi:PKD repeat protein
MPNANAVFFNTSINADSYFWDFGDGATSTDQDPWHTYTAAGDYSVMLIAYNSSYPADTLIRPDYIHVLNPSGINNIQAAGIKIYPNPFSDHISIKMSKPAENISAVRIFDISGRVLKNIPISANQNKLLLSAKELNKGIYLLEIISDSGKVVYKVVKE